MLYLCCLSLSAIHLCLYSSSICYSSPVLTYSANYSRILLISALIKFSFILCHFLHLSAIFSCWSYNPCYSCLYLNSLLLKLACLYPNFRRISAVINISLLSSTATSISIIHLRPAVSSVFLLSTLQLLNQINQLLVLSSLLDLNNQDQPLYVSITNHKLFFYSQ
jgi:hypothetical protein